MPFKTFYNWLFDGSKTSEIPKPQTDSEGKIITPDILKYNSPITNNYMISMFLKKGPLNYYLNKHFNNMNLYYMDKAEMMKFIKRCVMDFKISRRDITYVPAYRKQDKLINKLRQRFPILKIEELKMLSKLIDDSDEKGRIYQTLGLEIPKKKKISLKKKKRKVKKITEKEFLEKNFSIVEH
jgi:hypothetical protein